MAGAVEEKIGTRQFKIRAEPLNHNCLRICLLVTIHPIDRNVKLLINLICE